MTWWRSERAMALGLFLAAAAERLLFLRATVDRELPFSVFYYGDSRLYREFALSVLRGEAFDQGIPFHPPLLAYVLAAIISAVGENPGAVRAVLAVFASLAAPLTYMLGLRLWGRRTALLGALLVIFSFGLTVASVSPNVESVYIPILLAQALAIVALGDAMAGSGAGAAPGQAAEFARRAATDARRSGARAVGSPRKGRDPAAAAAISWRTAGSSGSVMRLAAVTGLVLGVGSLARAEHLGLALAIPASLALGWRGMGLRRIAGASIAAFVTAGAILAPWALHNFVSLGRYNAANPALAEPLSRVVVVTSYGALNFALANSPGSDGTFKPDLIVGRGGGDKLDLRDPRHLNLYLHGYREGIAFLLGHPAQAARLIARKLAIASEAWALGFGLSDWPAGLEGKRRAVDLFAPSRKVLVPISLALMGAGLWLSRAWWRRGSAVWMIALHKAVICAAFFGYVRLFVQLAPFAYLLQAYVIVTLWTRIPRPAVRKAMVAFGLALALGLVVELGIGTVRPRNFTASGSADPATGKIIQDSEVDLAPAP